MATCRTCDQPYDPRRFPLCSYCGALLVEIDELDLSPDADILIIYKEVKLTLLN